MIKHFNNFVIKYDNDKDDLVLTAVLKSIMCATSYELYSSK